jgi:hypothetical protein
MRAGLRAGSHRSEIEFWAKLNSGIDRSRRWRVSGIDEESKKKVRRLGIILVVVAATLYLSIYAKIILFGP